MRNYPRRRLPSVIGLTLAIALLFATAHVSSSVAAFRPPSIGTNGWYWPVVVETTSPYFGFRDAQNYPSHLGADFPADLGQPVYAVTSGDVVVARSDVGGYGRNGGPGGVVGVMHETSAGSSFYALYGHLDSIQVSSGGKVAAGGVVGYINDWNPPHLHFGIRPGGIPTGEALYKGIDATYDWGYVDPIQYLKENTAPGPSLTGDSYTALIIDSSGSMGWNDSTGLRIQAAKQFIDQAEFGDSIAVVHFASTAKTIMPMREIRTDADRIALKQACDTIGASGGTDIGAALNEGYRAITAADPVGIPAAILLTDGDGGYSNQVEQFKSTGIPIYTIGLGSAPKTWLLNMLAADTGGKYYASPTSGELQSIFAEIWGAIHGSYCLLQEQVHMTERDRAEYIFENFIGGSLQFVLSWPGSDCAMTITSPSGQVFGPDSPGVYYAKGATYEIYKIANAEPGEWRVSVEALEMPPGGSLVSLRVEEYTPDATQDTTPPQSSIDLAGAAGHNGWFLSDVQVSISAEDEPGGSGVAAIEYSLDSGDSWNEYSAPFTITTEGQNSVLYRARDVAGNQEAAQEAVVKIDKTAPILELAPSTSLLWPPNHQMVPVQVAHVLDDSVSGPADVMLVSVTSNEPDNGLGDGDMRDDIQFFDEPDDFAVLLRAERSGRGSGRVYTLTYRATDIAGNSTTSFVSVLVPRNR